MVPGEMGRRVNGVRIDEEVEEKMKKKAKKRKHQRNKGEEQWPTMGLFSRGNLASEMA